MFKKVALGDNLNTGGSANIIRVAELADIATPAIIERYNKYKASATNQTDEASLPSSGAGSAVGNYNHALLEDTYWKVVGSTGNHVKLNGNLSIVDTHVMASGKKFTSIEAQYRSPEQAAEGSKEYQVTGEDVMVPFKVAGNVEENVAEMLKMVARPVIIHIEDNDGNIIQYGDVNSPAYIMNGKSTTGKVANEFKGSEFTISCHVRAFYRGSTSGLYA